MVVLVPGLYTVFEALTTGVPVILLPPTNYTQVVQFNWYADNGLVEPDLRWTDLVGLGWDGREVTKRSDELELVSECRAKFASPSVANEVAGRLRCVVERFFEDPQAYRSAQARAAERIVRTYVSASLPTVADILGGL